MPAMQRGMCSQGRPRAELAAYYRRRAEGGVGLGKTIAKQIAAGGGSFDASTEALLKAAGL